MIVDPTDRTKAIDPATGNMATEVRIAQVANPEAPTMAEINAAVFLGHAAPTPVDEHCPQDCICNVYPGCFGS